MSDKDTIVEEPAPPKPEEINRLKTERIDGFESSDDGRTIQVILSGETVGRLSVTFPAEQLPALWTTLEQIIIALRGKGIIPGGAKGVLPRPMANMSVGNFTEPEMQHVTAVMFDKGSPNEVAHMMTDHDAFMLVDMIEGNLRGKYKPEALVTLRAAARDALRKGKTGGNNGHILLPGMPGYKVPN